MARLKIEGVGTINVDDGFKNLSPDEQNAFVEHVAAQIGKGVKSNVAAPQKQQEAPGVIESGVRSLAMGIPFSDRAVAAAETLAPKMLGGTGKGYSENLAAERAANEAVVKEYPIGSFVGSLIGGAALPMGVLGKAATIPATLAARGLLTGGAGAGVGGLYGISSSPDLTDNDATASSAVQGAAFGGVAGNLAPYAGAGVGKGLGLLAARRAPGMEGLSPSASRIFSKAAGDDLGAIRTKAGDLTDEAMVADLGPGLRSVTQGAVQRPEGREFITKALETRSNEGDVSRRIVGTVETNLGKGVPSRELEDAIRKEKAYQDAYNYDVALGRNGFERNAPGPVDISPVIAAIDKARPNAAGDVARALDIVRGELHMPNPAYETGRVKPSDLVIPKPQERAQSMRAFVRGLGGVQDEGGDLASAGINSEMIGLVNKRGLPMDKAREAAAEAGYFDHLYGSPDRAVSESTINDLIDAIHSNGTAARDQGIVDTMAARSEQRGGMGQREFWDAMRGQAADLTPPKVIPKTNAEALSNVKFDVLDKMIKGEGVGPFRPGTFSHADAELAAVRKALNAELEAQVPNYDWANQRSQQFNKVLEAHNLGGKILQAGPEAIWPQELRGAVSAMTPEELKAARAASASNAVRNLRTKANDIVAGRNIVKGETDFNRENLGILHGEKAANEVTRRIEAERHYSKTMHDVLGNSATAQRLAAKAELEGGALEKPPMTIRGLLSKGLETGANKYRDLLRGKATAELSPVLMRQGSDIEKTLKALEDWRALQELARRNADARGQSIGRGLLAPFAGGRAYSRDEAR